MPEWGMILMPKALLKKGYRDMLRLSDARMSGTSYGACILHIAPEAFVGGPLALIQNGDMIEVDIPNRSLNVDLSEANLPSAGAAGLPQFPDTNAVMDICTQHIEQADKGCDFDFLRSDFGAPVEEPEIN